MTIKRINWDVFGAFFTKETGGRQEKSMLISPLSPVSRRARGSVGDEKRYDPSSVFHKKKKRDASDDE